MGFLLSERKVSASRNLEGRETERPQAHPPTLPARLAMCRPGVVL